MTKVKVEDEDIIGHKFHSNYCNDFTVLRKTQCKTRGTKGNFLYEIEFDEINGVKYRKKASKSDILTGKVMNPYFPKVFNVGYRGEASYIKNAYEYNKWIKMLSRCYNLKDKKYKNYGAKGVYVCDRWKCFKYFLEDFELIEGYEKGKCKSLDKDFKSTNEPKYYSLDTCCLVSVEQNSKEMRTRLSPYFKAIAPNGSVYICNCQLDFARKNNLTKNGINDVLRGRQKSHRGWKFTYLKKEEEGINSD